MATPRKRGRAGQRDRARRLRLYPLCKPCQDKGKVTATQEIDHIIELEDDGPDNDENCQGICKPCHKAKTRESEAARNGVYGYDAQGKPLDPEHAWGGGGQKLKALNSGTPAPTYICNISRLKQG